MLHRFANWRALAPMAEGDPSAVPGGTGDPAAANTSPTAPAPQSGDPLKQFAEAVGWRNPEEIKTALKTVRDQGKAMDAMREQLAAISKGAKVEPTPQATTGDARVEALEARMRFRETLIDHEVPKDKREIFERLWAAERPSDLGDWMTRTMGAFAPAAAPAAATAPKVPLPNVSNGGPPIRETTPENLPADPFQWPLAYAQKIGINEFQKAVRAFTGRGGQNHPFAEFHEQRQGNRAAQPDLSALAKLIAAEVGRSK